LEFRGDLRLRVGHFLGLAEAVEDDVRAGRRHGAGDAQTDPAGGPGYQRDLARKGCPAIDIFRGDGDVHGSLLVGLRPMCQTGRQQDQCRLAKGSIECCYGSAGAGAVSLRGELLGRAMEMHQVRYFLATVSELNFTKAAEKCNVTQPSLTRAIKQLE